MITILAQTQPADLAAFQAEALELVQSGTSVAIAAAVLSLGWVAFRIVRKYTAGAAGEQYSNDPEGGRDEYDDLQNPS